MNKIYLGEVEVANTGGGGGGEGYVSDASFSEMTKVAASALLDLKGLEDNIEAFDEKIDGHVEAIDTQIQGLQSSKADASTVYDKNERDNTDKVAAAAIASLDGRVTTLEQGGGGGGGGITPAQLDASLKAYTYDKAHIDASIDAIEPGISYAELDASLKAYTYDKATIDASFNYLDSSIVALDASVKSFDASIQDVDASVKSLDSSVNSLDASVRASASASRIIAAIGKSNVESRTDTKYEATSEFGKYPKNLFYDGGDPNVVLHVGCGLGDEDREDAIQIFDNGNIIFLDINKNQRTL
jgi:prefoldin subunit 5